MKLSSLEGLKEEQLSPQQHLPLQLSLNANKLGGRCAFLLMPSVLDMPLCGTECRDSHLLTQVKSEHFLRCLALDFWLSPNNASGF